MMRLFQNILREIDAFIWKCEAFIKIKILSEDFSREIEVFSKIARLFKCISKRIEAFLNWCEAFSKNPRLLPKRLTNTENGFLVLDVNK
jgi:hypothetical protein